MSEVACRGAALAGTALLLFACFEPGPLGVEPTGDELGFAGGSELTESGGRGEGRGEPDATSRAEAEGGSTHPREGLACVVEADCQPAGLIDLCAGTSACVDFACQHEQGTAITCGQSPDPCYPIACVPETGLCAAESICQCEPLPQKLSCIQKVSFSTADSGASGFLQGYPCTSIAGEGAEHVVLFEANETEIVELSAQGGIDGVIVIDDASGGCAVDQCVAGGAQGAVFQAEAGRTYGIVVEHAPGPSALVELELSCGVSSEVSCSGGIDEDGNGLTDCEDPTCLGTPECPPAGESACDDGVDEDFDGATDCEDLDCALALECIQYCVDTAPSTSCGFSQSTGTGGGKAKVDEYPCGPPADGKEVVYAFTSSKPAEVSVSLAFPSGGLYVMEDQGFGCSPVTCFGYTPGSGAGGEGVVNLSAEAGRTYYFAIDQPAGLEGQFSFKIQCAQ